VPSASPAFSCSGSFAAAVADPLGECGYAAPVDDREVIIERTAQRFARASGRRGTYYYVRGKLRGDPATRAMVELGALGDVLDVGCGRGHLAVYLLETGLAKQVHGIDWDEEKVALANRAAEGLHASFEKSDVRDASHLRTADTVLLIDVLHYLDAPTQDALVASVADFVRPGGRLVVRDATTGYGWRSFVTRSVEWFSTAIRFNVGERVAIRDLRAIVPLLEARGFRTTIEPCWDGTPFSNVLLVATR
jgi:2-polyprenyl-3-methyl-5-hydroxy-6-metoxy-1,4-benzoquinol methylase